MAEAHHDEIAKLEALYGENPDGRVFIHLAEAYRRAGELDQALGVLQDGIGRHADYSSAHVVLGRVLQDQGKEPEAADAFRRVLELDAHNLVALRCLGDIARNTGRGEEALGYYRRLQEMEPADEELKDLILELEGGAPALQEAAPVAEDGGQEQAEAWAAEATDEDAVEEPLPALDAPDTEEDRVEAFSLSDDDGFQTGPPVEETYPSEPGPEAVLEPEEVEAEPVESEALEGLEAADQVLGADEVNGVEALEIEAEEYGDGLQAADDLPEIEGMEGVETAGSPQSMPDVMPSVPRADDFSMGGSADEEEAVVEEAIPDAYEPPAEPEPAPEEEAPPGEEALAGEPVDEETPVEAAGPVYTETMARVYARQGLYERAIDVYRELVRQRPEDAGLQERLTEVEAMAASEAPAETGVEEPVEAAALEAPVGEAPDEDAPVDEAPAGEALESVEAAEGEPLPFLDELPVTDEEAALEQGPEPVAEPEPVLAEASVDEAPPVDEPLPFEEPAAVEAPPEPETLEAEPARPDAEEALPSAEDVESVWTGADGAVGDEETPYAWAESDAEEQMGGEAISDYLRSLASWGGQAGPGEDTGAAPPSEAEAAPAAEEAAPPPEPEGDDDDLDMFRAWLESLKR